MRFETVSSPHVIAPTDVSRVMRQVLYALVPGSMAMVWYFGWGVLVNIALAVAVALVAEAGMLRARARPLRPYLGDYSATITAWLLALSLPPLAPWWLTVVGVGFAIVVAKHLYGGLGYNPFNPAMVGYVVLLISFPAPMTQWLPPHMLSETQLGLGETLAAIFMGRLPDQLSWDALTMATPLDTMRTQLGLNQTIEEIRTSPLWGDFGGLGWEWAGNWFLLGGLWLAYRRVIAWQIPVGMLGALIGLAALFFLLDPDIHPFPAFHVFSGGAILGAFFIATDPVTASSTPTGRLVYGAGIGVLTYVIRSWGGYPDGVAFSVLLMNMAAPTIDRYTRPRTFGREPEGH